MKYYLLLIGLFISSCSFAGTRTLTFGPGGGSITISSGAVAGGGSPLTFVQAVSTSTTDGGCGSTLVMTPTAGNLLVLGCATPNSISGITVTDASDTWLVAGSSNGVTAGYFVGIWYVKSAVGGATTVTAATNSCNGVNYCILAEYSGQNTISTFDVFSASAPVAGAAVSPITTLSTTTTSTNELMFSFGWANAGGAITAQTGTSRFNSGPPSGVQWFVQDANVPTASVYISTWTETAPFSWMAAEAAFNHL